MIFWITSTVLEMCRGVQGLALDCVPTAFLTNLLQASEESRGTKEHLEAVSVRNRTAADAIALAQQPPKLAELMRLQDDLHKQLDASAAHTSGQLASAGTLYMSAARVTPPSAAPRACALLVNAIQGARDSAAKQPVTSLETLYVSGHCMHELLGHFDVPAREPLVPEGVCGSIQVMGKPARLLATQDESKESAALQDLEQSGHIDSYAA
jgi:hypothetical protein